MLLQAKDDIVAGTKIYDLLSTISAGKREAQCANQLTSEQAAEVAKDVAEKCSNLDFDPEVGMTRRDVDLSFDVSDGEYVGTSDVSLAFVCGESM